MITSFKFSISLSKSSNVEIIFFFKLTIRLAVSDIVEDLDTSKFALDDTFSSIFERGLFLVF